MCLRALAAILAGSAIATAGCGREPSRREEASVEAASAENEPIAVRAHGRELRVHCESACVPQGAELERLYDACRADPLSAPHAVGGEGGALVALGCCTVAESAYREACGDEAAAGPCSSAWLARCARGGS